MEAFTSFVAENWGIILAACLAVAVIIISICLGKLNTKSQRLQRKLNRCVSICNAIASGEDVSACKLAKCKKQLEGIINGKKINKATKAQAASILSIYFTNLPEDNKMLVSQTASRLACGKAPSAEEENTINDIAKAQMELDDAIIDLRKKLSDVDAEIEARTQDLVAEFSALSHDAKQYDTLWQIANCKDKKERKKAIKALKKANAHNSHLKACLRKIGSLEKDGLKVKKQLYKKALDRKDEITESLTKSTEEWASEPVSKKKILSEYWKNKAADISPKTFKAEVNNAKPTAPRAVAPTAKDYDTSTLPFTYPTNFFACNKYFGSLAAASEESQKIRNK